jgi:hypothetical protein
VKEGDKYVSEINQDKVVSVPPILLVTSVYDSLESAIKDSIAFCGQIY